MKTIFNYLFIWLIILPFNIFAIVPNFLNYQGRLIESDGTVISGEHEVEFRIYDAMEGEYFYGLKFMMFL